MASLNTQPNPYAQQNGAAAPSAYVRPQFRRQGSSYGPGHVHNMAVMVAPTKVDYSVTKGGLRLWAVLFVFIFLCSAMLTIFSDNDDDNLDVRSHAIQDVDDDDEKAEAVKREPEEEEVEPPPPAPPDIQEEEEEEHDEEELLLASLREKARRLREKETVRKQEKDEIAETAQEEKEEEVQIRHKERRKRDRRKAKEVEEKEETEEETPIKEEKIEDVEEVHHTEDVKVQEMKEVPRRGRRKAKAKEVKQEEEEPVLEPVTKRGRRRKAQEVEEVEKEEIAKEAEEKPEPAEEPIDEDQPQRQPRKQRKTGPKRSAPLSNPTVEETPTPRKNLLRTQKKKKTPVEVQKEEEVEEDIDENNEDGNDDQQEDEESESKPEPQLPIREVVSIRKRTGHYNRKAITNKEDYKHRNKLDLADYLVEKHEFDTALKTYDQVLASYRDSPRARFGRARVMQLRSEFEEEDHYLDQALAEYQLVLDNDDTPDPLFRQAAENLMEAARFRGNLHKVLTVQRLMIDKFPDEVEHQNDFGLTFLMMGRVDDARKVFENILEDEPNNAMALAYYGYILKVYDKEVEKGIMAMRRGLRLSSGQIRDPKFYYHLGDGLMRLGRMQECYKVYEEAAELGLFPSTYQRSTYNLEGLTARTWWTLDQSGCGRYLRGIERQWTVIREESQELWNEHQILFEPEDPHLTDGLQSSFYFMRDSEFNHKNCELAPKSCAILKKFVADANCDKGEIKISVIKAGTRIWPHCGPMNFILEAQLGLVIPSEARLRVGKETRGWKTGRFVIFDESFEHEIWFDGATSNTYRIVLSIDLWHPEVPLSSRTEAHVE